MKPYHQTEGVTLYHGDALKVLSELESESVQCAVTSPPYLGLRDYGESRQIGLENSPSAYVERLVSVFDEVRRVLRSDGTLWLNLGDSYCSSPPGNKPRTNKKSSGLPNSQENLERRRQEYSRGQGWKEDGLKAKDLIGIPWAVAFALRDAGWWLRSDIIWAKGSCMPESIRDRPTRSHEFIFLLTKSARYFYDADAIREEAVGPARANDFVRPNSLTHKNGSTKPYESSGSRNARSVWRMNPKPFPESHFAVFPSELPRRCILAGTSAKGACSECGAPWARITERQGVKGYATGKSLEKRKAGLVTALSGAERACPIIETVGWRPTCDHDAPVRPCIVLDPFNGAGTSGMVAAQLDRRYIGIDLNSKYLDISRERILSAETGLTISEMRQGQQTLFSEEEA